MSGSSTAEATSLGKKDKKKLKKLRNRVFNVQHEGERSGLLTPQEWDELQRLDPSYKTSSIGPAIRIRRRKEGIKVEGAQHRDLLAWLMKQILFPEKIEAPISKKRKREEQKKDSIDTVSLPPWVSIHNPGTVSSIVALEVQVPRSESLQLSRLESFLESHQDSSSIKTPTKWFQGHNPRSITDSLLYFSSKPIKKINSKDVSKSSKELLADLEDMLIQPHEWEKEGYPILDIESETRSSPQSVNFPPSDKIDLTSVSIEEAMDIVNKIGSRVKEQDEEDDQLYVATCANHESNLGQSPRVFGMDCEMVRTSAGSELARITLVQFQTFEDDKMTIMTVMDELVKPTNAVLDYLTKHSGMTPKLLEPVTTRLAQVQVALLRCLRPNDILIGHSLENDLKAVHLIHPRVIDTALLFRPSRKRVKFSLKHLSAYLLQKKIQTESHCSEEDASIALELAIRRAWHGESFHVPSGDERRSVLDGLSSARIMCTGPADWLHSHITNNSNGVHALGYEAIAESKKAILSWISSARKTDCIFSQMNVQEGDGPEGLQALEDALVRATPL